MATKGIDVSVWQGNIDFSKVKAAGIDFVIIRAGYGRLSSQKDKQFEAYYAAAKAAGLKVGAYWYSYAQSASEAKLEANACIACIKGKSFDMPIYYDLEDGSMTPLGKSTLTSIAKAFCEEIKKSGYKAGVYANLNWFNNYLDYNALKKLYSIWLAQWSNSKSRDCDVWQYADNGKISGINGNVDMNYCYADFGKAANSGSTSKSTTSKTTTTNKPTTSKTATSTVKAGMKLSLKSVPLYVSSTAKTKANTLTGTYYLWSTEKVGGRYRITNSTANVGKAAQVTGWMDSKYVTTNTTTTTKTTAKKITVGGKVKVKKAVTYDGKSFATYYDKYDVIEVSGDRVVIGIGKTVTAAVKASNLTAF